MTTIKATIEDLDFFMDVYNDPSFLNQNENNNPISKHTALTLLIHPFCNWNVIYNDSVKVGIFTTFVRYDGIYFGIGIHKNYRNKGYATKTIKLFLNYYDTRKTNTFLEVFNDNFVKKTYEKLGYKDTKNFITVRNRKFVKMFRESC